MWGGKSIKNSKPGLGLISLCLKTQASFILLEYTASPELLYSWLRMSNLIFLPLAYTLVCHYARYDECIHILSLPLNYLGYIKHDFGFLTRIDAINTGRESQS